MITLEMVKDGFTNNLIRLINTSQGVACQIGEPDSADYFYFEDSDYDMTAEECKTVYSDDEIADMVFDALESLRAASPLFDDEVEGYETYLTKSLYGYAPDFSTRELFNQLIEKLELEKNSYRGSVRFDDNGKACLAADNEMLASMLRIIRACALLDLNDLRSNPDGEKDFCAGTSYLLSCESVFPYLLKRINNASNIESVQRAVVSGLQRARDNLEPIYVVLLFGEDLVPANLYRIPHGLGFDRDPERTKEALLDIAEKDFFGLLAEDDLSFEKGTFGCGAIRGPAPSEMYSDDLSYELVSAEIIRSIGYGEMLLLLERGELPMCLNLPE